MIELALMYLIPCTWMMMVHHSLFTHTHTHTHTYTHWHSSWTLVHAIKSHTCQKNDHSYIADPFSPLALQLDLDEDGYIKTKAGTTQTNVPGDGWAAF